MVLPTDVKLPPWTFLYTFSQEVKLSKSVENTRPVIILVEDLWTPQESTRRAIQLGCNYTNASAENIQNIQGDVSAAALCVREAVVGW